ncbi:MAG: PadR family transcriptional regulator [Desulfurococcaceae archaeon]|jgi:DNA-binding PadR family transcriptional regulator|nr:PadR family transcriptional regulator [Desulfurococcaceae archaeon]
MSEPRALVRLRKKLTVENLWLYIIKILKESKPLRAYDIKVSLRERFNINPPAVTVYTVLYRMRRDGLIEVRREGDSVVYTPTERGLEAFKEGIAFIEEVLAKLKL